MAAASLLPKHGTPVFDVVVGWLFIAASLVFLDVPFLSAVLLASALAIQAGLGVYLLRLLIPDLYWTKLLLLGPGLIVGGAATFAVFQLSGRGGAGLAIACTCGISATVISIRQSQHRPSSPEPSALWAGLGAGAALALSSQFAWLILVALASGVIFIVLNLEARTHRYVRLSLTALAVVIVGIALRLRGEWWWVITDDYLFFEVLARHLSQSGPLSDWGTINFAKYHWLSYGWSGLLNDLALSPPFLTTLTRVMPFAYSLSLASSLLLIARKITPSKAPTSLAYLMMVTVLCTMRLDWSGTSTAGVYAALTGFVAVLLLTSETSTSVARTIAMCICFATVIVFTKFASVLTVPALAVAYFAHRKFRHEGRLGVAKVTGAVFLTSLATASTIPLLSSVLGLFYVDIPNPNLGTLATRGTLLAFGGVTLTRAWQIVAVVIASIAWWRLSTGRNASSTVLVALGPLVAFGVLYDLVVSGNANTAEYFSEPNYFLASLVIGTLFLSARLDGIRQLSGTDRFVLSASCVMGIAIVVLARLIALPEEFDFAILRRSIGDARLVVGLISLVILVSTCRRHYQLVALATGLLLCTIAATGLWDPIDRLIEVSNRESPSRAEVESFIGSFDSELAGKWLRANSELSDRVATNYLRDPSTGAQLSDFSLAAWSEREFLLVGPRFSESFSSIKTAELLSESFADQPTEGDATELSRMGVQWFIIDLLNTDRRSWMPFGEVVYKTDRFWILRLTN